MIIVEVQQGSRKYAFTSNYKFKEGLWVMCDTVYGDSPGKVTDCFEVNDTDSELFKKYLKLMGAYEPLKEVVGLFVPMELIEQKFRKVKK